MRHPTRLAQTAALAVAATMLLAGTPAGADPTMQTIRVSVASAGQQADRASTEPTISADGRHVAFRSAASNLVPHDTNDRRDIFVRDLAAGTTTRVSVGSAGQQADRPAEEPAISADGRHVAFSSWASNLVAGDTNNTGDVFVRDLAAGTTTRVSVSSTGQQANSVSAEPAISADGRHVAFVSWASNLVGGDTDRDSDVFVHDLVAGTTTRVSVTRTGQQANAFSEDPTISADGRHVAFLSWASNLVAGDTNKTGDVFVRDRVAATTTRVSVSSTGQQANASSNQSAISADGRHVAFLSGASTLVAGDTNDSDDVFVRDMVAGTTTRASVSTAGQQGDWQSYDAAISADGRVVAFTSGAANLVVGDTNGMHDVFVRDLVAGTTTRVSVSSAGRQASRSSYDAAVSADGRAVAFTSQAPNLIADDTNSERDVFMRPASPVGSADQPPR